MLRKLREVARDALAAALAPVDRWLQRQESARQMREPESPLEPSRRSTTFGANYESAAGELLAQSSLARLNTRLSQQAISNALASPSRAPLKPPR